MKIRIRILERTEDLRSELITFLPQIYKAIRRVIRVIIFALIVIGLANVYEAKASPHEKPIAVATISILADFVKAVAGNTLVVETLVNVGGDPHTYEPVPSDARKLANASIVFRNGLGLERWIDKLIGDKRENRPVVTLTDGIYSLSVNEGGFDGKPDPHAWMDPKLASLYVDGVEQALRAKFPQHAETYINNASIYREQLSKLEIEISILINKVPLKNRQFVTTHDSFRYFSQRFGLTMVASIWGISTETEPSAREIVRIIEKIKKSGVRIVFIESTINPKLMQRIAKEAQVGIGEPLYGDSVGMAGSGADNYLGMMRANAKAIANGLSGQVAM